MAFSMFLRNSGCTSRIFSQQIMRMTTQPALSQRTVASSLPLSIAIKEAKCTPLLNSVRSFRTTIVRRSGEKPHDHAKLWVVEKATSAILVPLIPLALMVPNKLFDSLLAILVTAHTFWGLEAIVVEYVRVLLFGPVVPQIAMGIVYFVSIVHLGGLFYLILNDIGLSRAFWKIWKGMKPKRTPPPGSAAHGTVVKDTRGPEEPKDTKTCIIPPPPDVVHAQVPEGPGSNSR